MEKYYFAFYNCENLSNGNYTCFNGVFKGSLYEHIKYLKDTFTNEIYSINFYKEISSDEYEKLKDIL